ncbi:MAG: hypothetical protein WD716_09365 [Fimbriimonadaceae bacterium]
MEVILGDVLATIAIILFSGLAAWAGGLLSAMIFPERTERASNNFEYRPWATFFIGLALMLVSSFFGAVLFGIPNPVSRFLGGAIFAAILGIAVFGSGGLYRLVARRVRTSGGAETDYHSLAKAGMLVVAAELLPFFGWFLLFPYVLIASFGAGCMALGRPARKRVSIADGPPPAEAQ